MRMKNDNATMDDIEFMSFISNIRKGIVNQEFLDKVNQRYVGPYAAATQSHSKICRSLRNLVSQHKR